MPVYEYHQLPLNISEQDSNTMSTFRPRATTNLC